MASLIGIPLKKTNEVDLVKPLKDLFSSYCISADEPVQYDGALTELNKLRMNSTWRTLDKHESSLDVMTRYYDQLCFLEAKCPAVDIPVPFKWKDAFDKGTFFSGSASLTMSSLLYERICILFNIGAMQSQIAVGHATDIRNDQGLKLAAKFFQLSSGSFHHVKLLATQLPQDPTPDLQQDTLYALHSLMLAQAQESFFYKAVFDNMKEGIIAKVASQCDDLYGEALKALNKETTRVLWEKEWLSTVAGKQVGFSALAEYYQSLIAKGRKEFGEEIARLQHASELLKLAEVRGGTTFNCFKDYMTKVNYAYDEAKKDNDFIYHARIPDIKSLAPVGKAALAKPTPVQEQLNPDSQDLFTELLPLSVQQALQAFETRKIEIVSEERAKIQSQTQLLNGILASLNLPAALEDTTGYNLPQSLREKAEAIRGRGGLEALQRSIGELPSLLERNKEILDECEKMLTDEQESDEKLRNRFKTQWARTPSSKLNESLKANINKYRNIINNAINADDIVKNKFHQHKDKIILLCCPEEELLAEIPKGNPMSNSSAAEELRALMDQVKELLDERTALKEEIESTSTDMKAKFLSALSQDGGINEQALSVESLGEAYGQIQKSIRENLERQEKLVEEIQRVNTEFCKEKQGGSGREAMLSELAAAHDVYMELSDNIAEGTKFYNSLTEVLVIFQNKISDFCFARKTEREELCKDLQANIVQEASNQPTPSAASHHNQTAKPARPPPPKPAHTSTPGMPASSAPPPSAAPYACPSAANAAEYPSALPPYPVYPVFPGPYPTQPAQYYAYPPMPPQGYPPVGYQAQQPQVPPQGYPQPSYPQQQQYYHQYYPSQK